MENKTIAIALIVTGVASFAAGRWLAPTKIETKTETVTVEKKVIDNEQLEKFKSEYSRTFRKVITEITRPDGTKEKTTKYVARVDKTTGSESEKKTHEEDNKESKSTETKVVENQKSGLTISGMAGIDVTNLNATQKPAYGAQVYKNFVGPFGAGIFGLTNGTCGASVGVTF